MITGIGPFGFSILTSNSESDDFISYSYGNGYSWRFFVLSRGLDLRILAFPCTQVKTGSPCARFHACFKGDPISEKLPTILSKLPQGLHMVCTLLRELTLTLLLFQEQSCVALTPPWVVEQMRERCAWLVSFLDTYQMASCTHMSSCSEYLWRLGTSSSELLLEAPEPRLLLRVKVRSKRRSLSTTHTNH